MPTPAGNFQITQERSFLGREGKKIITENSYVIKIIVIHFNLHLIFQCAKGTSRKTKLHMLHIHADVVTIFLNNLTWDTICSLEATEVETFPAQQ
jgi:ribonuclease BN (tRNA processing enzyme)